MEHSTASLPLYIVDASAWSRYGTNRAVTGDLDAIGHSGIIMTCPPASLEYCFMARNAAEHAAFADRMARLKQPEQHPSVSDVLEIQSALWNAGLVRAAGPVDTLIAAYALLHDATVVSCGKDYGHLAAALDGRLKQIFHKI
ncbi:nucleic acid-binding protein [Arthrobacter crystallopoietes BAB-32]|uniref:Nucleic acid-binding protein n=1 Tax=Arthrobacter crystallopoietes BAB-32 TaxID=1246476 RepID=N1UU25_9MICC|nr:PIN domain-containing protein [Arthrobacter crystallopoietes]EMY33921.1 nucleic acid-binding protein [Arthrobacter crystallopoietes BAB-32]